MTPTSPSSIAPSVWLVRAGSEGEFQDLNIENGVAAIGWSNIGDLSQYQTREALFAKLKELEPNATDGRLHNFTGQIWAFSKRIKIGDSIVLPLKGRNAIALGVCKSEYRFRPDHAIDNPHTRSVDWIQTGVARNRFKQDLLDSLGAFMTVCRIRRNNAANRLAAILAGQSDPGFDELVTKRKSLLESQPATEQTELADDPDEDDAPIDYADSLLDQIRNHIESDFKNHALVDLVEAVLNAQDYMTEKSPPGPDGGVDLIAGQGPLGFGHPRIAVQVKSGGIVCDSKMIREFKTVIREHSADCGLYVCWGGFNRGVEKERRKNFLEIRYWDSEALIFQILSHYERFPEAIKERLPLKRVWMLDREA